MILIFTLLISSITSYAQHTLQELELQLRQEEERLMELGRRITAQEEVIFTVDARIKELYKSYDKAYRNQYPNNNQKILDQRAAEFLKAIEQELETFMTTAASKFKQNDNNILKSLLSKNLTTANNFYAIYQFNSLRLIQEKLLLLSLISQWEDCLKKIESLRNKITLIGE